MILVVVRRAIAIAAVLVVGCTTTARTTKTDTRASSDAGATVETVANSSPTSSPNSKESTPTRDAASAAEPPTVVLNAHVGPLPKLEVQEVEATGANPKGAFLSNDRKTLYVTNFGQLDNKRNVTIYDAQTLSQIGQIDLPAVVVEGIVSPDDTTLYLSSFWGHSVLFVDLATKSITHEVKTGHHPKVLTLSRDGTMLFAANWSGESVTQIDVPHASVVRTLKTGKNPRGLALTSKNTLYVANFYSESIDVFDGKDLEKPSAEPDSNPPRRRIPACKCPRHLALSPDEKTLFVSCPNRSEIHAIDLATDAVVHRVPIAGSSPKSIAISPDGRYVYSADYGLSRSVSVVDTSDWTTRTFTVPGMDRGSGIAVAADGQHAFVTGWYDAHVYRVGFEGSGGHPTTASQKIAAWLHRPFSRDPGDTK